MNVELRILTGRHAGTRLTLLPGSYQLGREEDVDLQLTDWTGPTLTLEIDADANLRYTIEDPAAAAQPMRHFVPACFDAIVLCAGPAEQVWPDELQLLRAALQPQSAALHAPASAARSAPRNRRLAWIALVSALALTLTAWCYDAPGAHRRHAAPTPLAQARQAFVRMGQTELRLRDAADHVEVEGMVRSEADAQRVEQWLDQHPGPWQMHFGVAESLIESMSESLHEPSLSIRYRGHGVYAVAGASEHRDAVRRRLEQLQRDMGSQVLRIDARLRALDPRDALPDTYDTALSVDELHYVETPDGSKHFNSISQ
ncbi:type III secretion protein HrpD [Xanthomonas hyacinthi]|uniref:Type III secretion protein HrpD n=1 Tax=Xanthomonas hyacinthi TaxID=56455 RepID=A0A2S7ERB2_9XANT|nr:HrpD5 family protein [Xanthomonas hyacinthi]KLD76405.1 type III secretion protein HrpD [Xanthomonas hyacinthi DSM 19077]PPU95655.1 type III secretion protein HrpD [Xanthomonas hyacinthi]QGY78065.1 type III secretion protein HrpD [Xanthomonas hyacinthi]